MLTELYTKAVLVDEELADLVWEAWDFRQISDETAGRTWWVVSEGILGTLSK